MEIVGWNFGAEITEHKVLVSKKKKRKKKEKAKRLWDSEKDAPKTWYEKPKKNKNKIMISCS